MYSTVPLCYYIITVHYTPTYTMQLITTDPSTHKTKAELIRKSQSSIRSNETVLKCSNLHCPTCPI